MPYPIAENIRDVSQAHLRGNEGSLISLINGNIQAREEREKGLKGLANRSTNYTQGDRPMAGNEIESN